jgi:hypothetical protein
MTKYDYTTLDETHAVYHDYQECGEGKKLRQTTELTPTRNRWTRTIARSVAFFPFERGRLVDRIS